MDDEGMMIKCACEASTVITAKYALLLESLGQCTSEQNYRVMRMGIESLLEMEKDEPAFTVTDGTFRKALMMVALPALLHIEMVDASTCVAVEDLCDTLRGVLPVSDAAYGGVSDD